MPITITLPCVNARKQPTGAFKTFRLPEPDPDAEPKQPPRRLRRDLKHQSTTLVFPRSKRHADRVDAGTLTHTACIIAETARRRERHAVRVKRRRDKSLMRRAAREMAVVALAI